MRKNQHGLGAIAALVVLVLLAALAAAIVSLSATQSTTAAQDVLAARAWQAARAGTEWGVSQALNNGDWAGAATPCTNVSRTATLSLAPASAFNVTVTCTPYNYNEGETTPLTSKTVRIYRIVAVACPDTSAVCPDNTAIGNPIYVERARSVIATD